MSDCVHVAPGDPQSRWAVRVPGSKSITNRALLLAGVASGQSVLLDPLVADDTHSMAAALRTLGVGIAEQDRRRRPAALGRRGPRRRRRQDTRRCTAGWAPPSAASWLPMLAAGRGRFAVDAHAQLRRRPLGPVLAALRAQGAAIDGEAFPLVIGASGLSGGEVEVDASVSSQFLSGLLMAAPFAQSRHAAALRDARQQAVPRSDAERDAGIRRRGGGRGGRDLRRARRLPRRRVPGRARCLDRLVLPRERGAHGNDRAAARARSPQRPRRATSSWSSFLERMGCTVRDGEALELTGPAAAARDRGRHGQQLRRVHDARLRGRLRRRPHHDQRASATPA